MSQMRNNQLCFVRQKNYTRKNENNLGIYMYIHNCNLNYYMEGITRLCGDTYFYLSADGISHE